MSYPLFPSRARVNELKAKYKRGTRVLLIRMNEEPWAPIPDNTRGTVEDVDDAGQIHCKFDNGRSLAIVPEVDSFRMLTEQEMLEEQKKEEKNYG